MASSQIEIVNIAFGFLGEGQIQSLAEISVRSEQANLHYEPSVLAILGLADWRTLMEKAVLSRDVATPPNEWSYQYTLPPQFVRMSAVYPRGPFEIYGQKIYSNETGLACDYVQRKSEAHFSQNLATVIGAELAVRSCMVISGDADLFSMLMQRVRPAKFAEALASDAQQRPNRRFDDAPFINCRA